MDANNPEEKRVLRKVITAVQVSSDLWDVFLECEHTVRISDDHEPALWMVNCPQCSQQT